MKRCHFFLLGLAVLLALNALNNPFILDDQSKISGNPDIRSLANLPGKLIYPYPKHQLLERNDPSRPLVFLIYTVLYAFGGNDPVPFHFVNALLHGVAGILVFLLLRRASGLLAECEGVWAPLLGAVFFLVTPIQNGTVIYAYGLSDVLSSALLLASVWCFVRRETLNDRDRAWSVAMMALALACKQSAIVAPALILAFDAAFLCRLDGARIRARLELYSWHLWAAGLYLLFRFLYFGGVGDLEGRGNTVPWLEYAFAQPAAVWKYLQLTLWPRGLALDHYLLARHFGMGTQAFALVSLAAGAGAILRRAWKNPTPAWRLGAFAVAWYLVSLAPTSSLFPTVDILVERRVYLANLGVFCALVLAYDLVGMGWFGTRVRKWALGLAVVHVASLGIVTLQRNALFRSNEGVWRDVARLYPESPRALNNLANVLLEKGSFAEAKNLFERLLQLYPSDYFAAANLGNLYEREDSPFRELAKALELFQRSVALNPDFPEGYYNLARLLQKEGKLDQAEGLYFKTLELKPIHVPALNNLGVLYMNRGEIEKAREFVRAALNLDAHYEPAQRNWIQLAEWPRR